MKCLIAVIVLGITVSPALHGQWCEEVPVPADLAAEPQTRLLSPDLIEGAPIVDLLALYIPQVGNAIDVRTLLIPQVEYLNAALARSGVPGAVRLVGVLKAPASLPYQSTPPPSLLADFASNAEARALRATHGADLMTLVVPPEMLPSNIAGLGFVTNRPESAYSMVSARAFEGISGLLAHEVGHNLGLLHDRAHSVGTPSPYGGRVYGHFGEFEDGVRFFDIMAYGDACPDGCQEVAPFYANPEIRYRGAAMGIAREREAALVLRQDALARASGHRATRQGGCVPDAGTLCLGKNRFAVTATWRTRDGARGAGTARSLTSDTGTFWFFSEENVEVIAKVVDGCALNERFWIFAGGLTDVNVTLTVTDTLSGARKTYANPQRTAFQPVQDTSAFGCP